MLSAVMEASLAHVIQKHAKLLGNLKAAITARHPYSPLLNYPGISLVRGCIHAS